MKMFKKTSVWASLTAFVWMLLAPNFLFAADAVISKEVGKVSSVEISLGKSRLYKYADPITRISVGDSAIADVMVVSPNQIYLLGKKVGSTNVFMWHANGNLSTLDVSVGVDAGALQSLLGKLIPGEKNIRASSAGESLVLSGQVSDSMKVQQAILIAQEYTGKKVLNMMTTDHLPQVLIEVKIAEIDKAVSDSLGIQVQGSNFSFNMLNGATAPLGFAANATGTVGTTNAWLQAQINSGLIKILAEPNIMAISGQEGEFLSGGIVFLPVPQSSGTGGSVITLQPQNYGVGVKFTPTVLSEGRINLKVSPQVSEVQTQGITVSAGGSTSVLPSITTRQASTTVQLYDGQSFAIGGLIKNNVAEVISAFPGLANVPVLGALFRSASFKADRSELLIVVTPHIVQPVANKVILPTDKYIPPTQTEFFVNGQLEGTKPESKIEGVAK
ncbi:type II and III secretion system protein family protein [Polynucleobacter sp. AP-Reno-20A-A9]|uniref:type II and III secretion system protein family protein n=1 Tax=Polynucleobacter sp. AP-Reno-20A-A9 TaxID=2576925 RepID=UPI001C0AA982|nr:type II and III secretion system protein family protein [Polynucleobacter sp. AP-Reno-20A-A9]MBU3628865.1 type II and III secretion system protein family protein [Polynucleobacter sp. AP-Reno-20A-A9]